ncbi:APC family permease [Croceicoccus mobilis]|uniref:Amino acid transporter n=1 Tax=Croceicoccus mobilis TaxID=1703339 RepID=A0A917DSY3_9SPHN|nr:amino acid permease [Croceicoccus mobilis]GGD65711.1 amino acid transporter [Croceicoccus mobilis]
MAKAAGKAGETLEPALSRWVLAIYGLGTILGAGIYVVVGKVAGEAGSLAPVAFLVAAVAAWLTGLSYGELSARIPESGGSAAFVARAFNRQWLTAFIGWAIIATGLISAATITSGFVGYLAVFVALPKYLVVPLVIAALAAIAAIGVKEAAWTMIATTALEVLGLLLVIGFAGGSLADFPATFAQGLDAPPEVLVHGVLAGTVLSFYAYIGFEDLATLSEETTDSSRAIPFAIITALAISLCLYLAVSAIAVSTLSSETLRESGAPLSAIIARHGGPSDFLALIGLVTILNGALAQIVMASRVIHDLGTRRRAAPRWLARISPRTRTPVRATVCSGVVIALLALFFPIQTLAAGTSTLMLLIFSCVCAGLVAIRMRGVAKGDGLPRYPIVVPILGSVICLGLMVASLWPAIR